MPRPSRAPDRNATPRTVGTPVLTSAKGSSTALARLAARRARPSPMAGARHVCAGPAHGLTGPTAGFGDHGPQGGKDLER